jgi:hypothetical protein
MTQAPRWAMRAVVVVAALLAGLVSCPWSDAPAYAQSANHAPGGLLAQGHEVRSDVPFGHVAIAAVALPGLLAKESRTTLSQIYSGDVSIVGAETASGGARFVVDSGGVASDTAPDLPGLARMHAEELITQGGDVRRAASAAVDTETWMPSFGERAVLCLRASTRSWRLGSQIPALKNGHQGTARNSMRVTPPSSMAPRLTISSTAPRRSVELESTHSPPARTAR